VSRRVRIDDLTGLAVPAQPALSPDGGRIAYVVRTLDTGRDRNVDQLWLVATDGGGPRRLTSGPADTAPAWSPDGSRLAFLRDGRSPCSAPTAENPRC
jgi:Tol biopolymer transport system component